MSKKMVSRIFKFPYNEKELHQITLESMENDITAFINEIMYAFGIPVTCQWDHEDNAILYDLNTEAKSYLHIKYYFSSNHWEGLGRYNKVFELYSLMDVLVAVSEWLHGREFINQQWRNALIYYGIRMKFVDNLINF